MIKLFAVSLLLFLSIHSSEQVSGSSDLFRTIYTLDSLLFHVGFNGCDISQFEQLLAGDFRFYHDQSGITDSKESFITGIRDGLCKLDYRPQRVLVERSMKVYAMQKDGALYGAIQEGRHKFYAIEKDGHRHLTSVARFTHVWLIGPTGWKLSSGLSYDHRDR